jgi:hypothetical protein
MDQAENVWNIRVFKDGKDWVVAGENIGKDYFLTRQEAEATAKAYRDDLDKYCIDCGVKLGEVDKDPNGDENCECAKCRAEADHDFDAEPNAKFNRRGERIYPDTKLEPCPFCGAKATTSEVVSGEHNCCTCSTCKWRSDDNHCLHVPAPANAPLAKECCDYVRATKKVRSKSRTVAKTPEPPVISEKDMIAALNTPVDIQEELQ